MTKIDFTFLIQTSNDRKTRKHELAYKLKLSERPQETGSHFLPEKKFNQRLEIAYILF
jgi:hypothetical protein